MMVDSRAFARIRAELPGASFTDHVRHLAATEAMVTDGKPLRVAVLRTYTVEAIEPILKLHLLIEGYRPSFWIGGYNQYVQEIVDSKSALHGFRPDLLLLMVRLEDVLPDFVDDFASQTPAQWEERLAAAARDFGALVEHVERRFAAQVLVQNFTLPVSDYFGIYGAERPDGQRYLVDGFNRKLAAELSLRSGAFVWDFDRFVRQHGYAQLYDAKQWYVSRSPYRQAAYPALVQDLMRYVRSALGHLKKCVVLDLDNTLWGGIVGEDGLEGIRLGQTYPGNCYRDFQRELLKLHRRGILLAIASKNNEEDAVRVIEQHPDMILRRQHFAAVRINWRDKATNLRELARELDLGLESFVFIDDNPAECELVRREIPECDVVLLPDKPYLLPAVPQALVGFENIRLTEEDRQKGAMYRARARRRDEESRFADLGEFLASLEIEVTIHLATPFSIPRIAQLTQKTNQLNMTTRRYTEAQIQSFVGDPRYAVYAVSSRDRFGDDGIIGVFILEFSEEAVRIDTFLLSCRVIGRGIEQAMVAFIADVARVRGATVIVGEFIPTAKNRPAAGVYEGLGFAASGDQRFVADLRWDGVFVVPPHISLIGADVRPTAVHD